MTGYLSKMAGGDTEIAIHLIFLTFWAFLCYAMAFLTFSLFFAKLIKVSPLHVRIAHCQRSQ